MSGRKLYLLALTAIKHDPADLVYTPQPNDEIKWEPKPGVDLYRNGMPLMAIWAAGAVVESEEQARAIGLQKIRADCPWQEGWVDHRASVNPVSRENLLWVCREATGDHDQPQGGGGDEWSDAMPGMIM